MKGRRGGGFTLLIAEGQGWHLEEGGEKTGFQSDRHDRGRCGHADMGRGWPCPGRDVVDRGGQPSTTLGREEPCVLPGLQLATRPTGPEELARPDWPAGILPRGGSQIDGRGVCWAGCVACQGGIPIFCMRCSPLDPRTSHDRHRGRRARPGRAARAVRRRQPTADLSQPGRRHGAAVVPAREQGQPSLMDELGHGQPDESRCERVGKMKEEKARPLRRDGRNEGE